MRLIDADLFKKNLGVTDNSSVFITMLNNIIDEQPTAFDKEKVIEELCNKIPNLDFDYNVAFTDGVECAISIVEKGGLDVKA